MNLTKMASYLQKVMRNGKGKGKGIAIPAQAWTGPGGSGRLGLPYFKKTGTRRW
jgi:hypothetical protein